MGLLSGLHQIASGQVPAHSENSLGVVCYHCETWANDWDLCSVNISLLRGFYIQTAPFSLLPFTVTLSLLTNGLMFGLKFIYFILLKNAFNFIFERDRE